MGNIEKNGDIFERISGLIESARRKVAATINHEMVILYWNIGKAVKEEIIKSDRAEYGKQIVQSLTAQLTLKYGRGFSRQNLWYMVQLYENYPILHALRGELAGLSWTHKEAQEEIPLKQGLKPRKCSNVGLEQKFHVKDLD